VALQEPEGQVAAEFTGPLLALVEGNQLVLILGVKHEVERGGSMGEEALAQFLVTGLRRGLGVVHAGFSGCSGR
jgi:hypothetical protein